MNFSNFLFSLRKVVGLMSRSNEADVYFNNSGFNSTPGACMQLDFAKGTNLSDICNYVYVPAAPGVTNGARCVITLSNVAHGSNVPAIGTGMVKAIVLGPCVAGDKLQMGSATNAGTLITYYAAAGAATAAKNVAMATASAAAGATALVLCDFYGSQQSY